MIRGHFDGASRGNPGPAGAGAVIYDGETVVWRCARALGTCTNNEAEYMALAILADELEARGVKSAEICGDSKLVISQISGAWKIKEPRLAALARPIMAKLAALGTSYRWIPRSLNAEADMLSNKALDEGDFTESLPSSASSAEKSALDPAKPSLTAERIRERMWLVKDGDEYYAVDAAHGCCTCSHGRGMQCRHALFVAEEESRRV